MRIIAIDYGAKRCGIAVTDPLQIVCSPHDTIETSRLIEYLSQYIGQNPVCEIVVGMPLRRNGMSNPINTQIEKLIVTLRNKFEGINVTSYDERYTSKIAKASILDSGAKKKVRQDKSLIDRVSASIILQDYIEYKKNTIDHKSE